MCQAKPGNRCSSHAKSRLTKSAQRLQRVLDSTGVTHPDYLSGPMRVIYNEVRQDVVRDASNYDATVEGIQSLNNRLENYRKSRRSQDEPEERDEMIAKLEKRLEDAKSLRERRKDAYKDSQSLKITAERNASRDHDGDEEAMRRDIDEEIGNLPADSEQYKTREREVVNSMYNDTLNRLSDAKFFVEQARKDFAEKVDKGQPYRQEAQRFREAYENLYRVEHRRDSLKQMKIKLGNGLSRYGN